MYNINSHYENLYSFAKTISDEPVLLYFFPFGSIKYENVEFIHSSGTGKFDCPLFLCFDQEPITEELVKIIQAVRQDWGHGKKLILINTEKHSKIKNQILKDYGVIDCYYFFHIFAASDWYRGYLYCSDITDPASRNIYKKYITYNRITGDSRAYRSLFVSKLAEFNLINYGNISYSDECPVHGNYQSNLLQLTEKYNIPKSTIAESILNLEKINFPLRIDNNDNQEIPNGSQTIDSIPTLMESFLHVVTETCFWETKLHLTEKIFKPIVCKQPFILLGCPHNLNYLKSYGFRTFDRWWDESYDQIDDPIERINAVVKIIKKICSYSNNQLEYLLKEMKDILEYNYELFYSKDFVAGAWNEAKNNMRLAVKQKTYFMRHLVLTENCQVD